MNEENQQQPQPRQWIGCVVAIALFVAALFLITGVFAGLLKVDF